MGKGNRSWQTRRHSRRQKEGKQDAIRMVVKRMREKGKTVQEISEIVGLEIEEIEKL